MTSSFRETTVKLLPSLLPALPNTTKTAGVMLSLSLSSFPFLLLRRTCFFFFFFASGLVADELGRILHTGLDLPRDGSNPGGRLRGAQVTLPWRKSELPKGERKRGEKKPFCEVPLQSWGPPAVPAGPGWWSPKGFRGRNLRVVLLILAAQGFAVLLPLSPDQPQTS